MSSAGSHPQRFNDDSNGKSAPLIVVKVGGSLYDHPRLGSGLRRFLDELAPSPVLLVPGGGDFADTVRRLDRVQALGEKQSHWLALRSLSVAGAFLDRIVGQRNSEPWVRVLDCPTFAATDEAHPDRLPHCWAVTTDSIAARVATVYEAARLVLLKSIDIPSECSWVEAAARGWVDEHFPRLIAAAPYRVEVVNLRRWLDERETTPETAFSPIPLKNGEPG